MCWIGGLISKFFNYWHQCFVDPFDACFASCFCGDDGEIVSVFIIFDIMDEGLNRHEFFYCGMSIGVGGFGENGFVEVSYE